jgi:hypothetical protein
VIETALEEEMAEHLGYLHHPGICLAWVIRGRDAGIDYRVDGSRIIYQDSDQIAFPRR